LRCLKIFKKYINAPLIATSNVVSLVNTAADKSAAAITGLFLRSERMLASTRHAAKISVRSRDNDNKKPG